MRTAVIVLAGFFLLAICVGVARGSGRTNSAGVAVFWCLWFVAAAINMWIGVSHAGYSVAEEAPIFLLIFGLPAAIALAIKWRVP